MTKNLRSSSLSEIPSTLNGPPGLLIGERKITIPTNTSKQMKDLSSAQRRDKQNSRIHENSKPPLIIKLINQPPIKEGRQSVIFDEGEEGLFNIDRRVLIDDEFY